MTERDLQNLRPHDLITMIEQQAAIAKQMLNHMLPNDNVDWRKNQPLVEFGDFVVYARFKDQPQPDPGFPKQDYENTRRTHP